jgi:UDP-glucose 4-epimerase
MRVAITGGLGFLGREAARRLAGRGHRVLALDLSAGEPPPGVEAARCDVGEGEQVRSTMAAFRPDAVVHLAALLTPESRADIVAATRVNALGTAHVLASAAAVGVGRVVYASSVAALGTCGGFPGDDAALRPGSVYGATKAFGEHLAAAVVHDNPRLSVACLRFGWIYGPGRERGWRDIQALIEAAVQGERTIAYPDYPDPIDWTWYEDAAEVIARSVAASLEGCRAVNVAGDKRRMTEFAACLAQRFPGLVMRPVQAAMPPSAWGFRNDGLVPWLGYQPDTPMEAGVGMLIDALERARAGASPPER